MGKIDYKNRALMMARAYSPEGTADVELYYDRFDKVLYFTDIENGSFFSADGTPYEPTPIPDGNKLIYCSLYNGVVAMKFANEVLPSSVIPENWKVANGDIFFANQVDNGRLLLFTMENSDTLFITTNFTNMVGDVTNIASIAAVPAIYKVFDTQEDMCAYYTEFGQTITEPDGTLYMDYSQGKTYLDTFGKSGIDELNGRWIYLITEAIPLDTDGTLDSQYYLYAYVEGQMTPNQEISTLCQI